MAWEYLYDKMDFRAWLIAGYLKGKTKDKTIFDINCMHAPLLRYLDPDYKEYIGNDLQEVFPMGFPRCTFYQITDERMPERLPEVDILVAMGIGGHEISHESLESPTMTQTIKDIISQKHPGIVVLEGVWAFEPIYQDIVSFAKSYRIINQLKVESVPDSPENFWVFRRQLIILEHV